MKKILIITALVLLSTFGFSQSEKTLTYTKNIIAAANLKLVVQTQTYSKAEFIPKHNYALEEVKAVCDSILKSKPSGWILNADKNEEKQYVVDGKILLITIYWTDEFIYFEFK